LFWSKKEYRLKGLPNLEHLWQLVAPDLQQDFPPLPSSTEVPNNLRVQLTSFIGREKEIGEIEQAILIHRLVTLTGVGGTGKTRPYLQVAADLLDQFSSGVWFVEPASLMDPELIPQIILSPFGVPEQAGMTRLQVLLDYLE
jgi:hypothetical protein